MMAKILCIDDEADIRRDIVEELRDAGYETVEAENGEAGLAAIKADKPDLVLCDITMPGMDGYQLLAELRENHPELADMPFVFLSALADNKQVIAGRSLGADDYLTKPVDFDMLLVTLKSRLRQVERMNARKERQLVKLYKAVTTKDTTTVNDEAPTTLQEAATDSPAAAKRGLPDQATTDEKDDESACQLSKQLSNLVHRNSGRVVVGRFHLIGLQEIKQELGDRWAQNAQRVYSIAEQTIEKWLTNDDILRRDQSNDFLVCFASLSEGEASITAQKITNQVRQAVLDSCEHPESSRVTPEVHTVQFADGEITNSDDLLSLVTEKLNQASERAEAAESTILRETFKTAKLRFREVQTRSDTTASFTIVEFDQSSLTKIERLMAARSDPAEIAAEIDLLTLGRVTEHIINGHSPKDSMMVAAVHFSTVGYSRYFEKYKRFCQNLTEQMRNVLIFNVKKIPSELTAMRISVSISNLRTFSRFRMVQINKSNLGNIELLRCQVKIVAFDFSDLADVLRDDWKKVAELIQRVHRNKARFFVDKVESAEFADILKGLGTDFLSVREPT